MCIRDSDDLGFGFRGTSQIAGIGADIIDNDRLAAGCRGPANTLIQPYAGVRSHRTFERAQDQHIFGWLFFDHVEAHPVVLQQILVEQADDAGH